jgi:hypothetical protein
MKTLLDKLKIKQFITTKPAFHKIFKGVLYTKDKDQHNCKCIGINRYHEKSKYINKEWERIKRFQCVSFS